ncbi:TolC family outer membrane protein [Xanthomonas campestris]|jgi:outer membrane protein|uniref:Type I secretion system outer membrane protein n=1 Tax=Xanthomonas campestris pv. campestris (strain B100) TaxID=509169 RepID=B0RP18_XANCB|nr:TolC family outer membrane protein [Xanthomonas campestris]AEL08529.1 outer membrane protein RaxC [Xanthomonas campestris pv. raphani 756C]AKS15172.1 membrane protein [Xanthomonas campestris pv. campestris]AKS19200.1 membrane protein [Xanthomonas campestris pv. campestris]ALE69901.1 membrane protein [Xanthomonas campestris pv. campestris]MCC3255313.1 TolC family outer membrane protein [Xanthomonas campestris pv. armoraciae]
MIRRSLVLALAAALSPMAAHATDLLQVYEMARNGDPQLAVAESTRLVNREGQVQARAALLPQLNGAFDYSKAHREIEGQDGRITTSSRSSQIQGSQTIFNWSQFSTLRAQREVAKAADFTLESANNDLITRTSAAYFQVLVGIESLAAAETNEAAAKKQFDYADKRLEVGLAPITDVHEARAQYDQARADTINARNTLKDYYQALTELTGQPVVGLRALPENFRPEVPAAYSNVDQLVASAIADNPALKAQQLQVSAAEASINAARAGHLPTVNLTGSVGRSNSWGTGAAESGVFTTQGRDIDTDSIGISVSIPIFAGGATQSAVRQAISQRDIQQDTYEQQKRALDRNTRNAYQTVVAGISEVEARRLSVVSAQAAYDASQVGLEVGTRTVLDVVQNQRTLFQAQQLYAQARYTFLQNRLLLAQAIGKIDIAELQDVNRLLSVEAEAKLQGSGSLQ